MKRKWFDVLKGNPLKIAGGLSGTLVGVLIVLTVLFNATITSYDVHCTTDVNNPFYINLFGELEYGELCTVPIKVSIPKGEGYDYVDMYSSGAEFKFSPNVNYSILYIKDGRCNSNKTTPHIGYCPINLSEKRREDKAYNFRWVAGKEYEFLLDVKKEDVSDVLKWTMFASSGGELDPYLYSPYLGDATIYNNRVFFNFTNEFIDEYNQTTKSSYAELDVYVVKGTKINETDFEWERVSENILVKLSEDKYKINITRLDNTPSYYGFVFNTSYRYRYDGDNNYYFYYSGLEKYIGVNNTGFCDESDECWTGEVDGLPTIFGGMFEDSFDPEVYLSETIYSSALTSNTQSDGNYSVLEINNSIIPYNNLVGYWAFDSDTGSVAYDYSNSSRNGVYNGNAYAGSGLYGKSGYYDGTGDYVSSTLNLSGYTAMSISVWVKPSSTGGNIYCGFVDSNNAYNQGFYFGRDGAGGTLQGYIGTVRANVAGVLQYDKWNYLTMVYNGTSIILYVNGTQVAIQSTSVPASIPAHTGINIGSNEFVLNGSIDEAMIFNIALNTSQINDIYNNQSSRFKTTGTTTLRQQTLNETGNNRVNVSTVFSSLFNSNVSSKVGYWDVSKRYNDTFSTNSNDLNFGLIRYYHADGSVNDSSGYGNNATLQNGANVTSSGVYNSSFGFNGSLDYISTPTLDIYNKSFSISGWINPTSTATDIGIVRQLSAGEANKYLHIKFLSNKLAFNFFFDDLSSVASIPTNTWTYFVANYNADTNTQSIYLNGIFDGSRVATNDFIGVGGDFEIGRYYSYYSGYMDEIMVFNRSLSASEIKELYVKGRANWEYTSYQDIDNNTAKVFTIDSTTSNVLTDFKLTAGTNQFYTPILYGGVNLTTWTAETGDTIYPIFSDYYDNTGSLIDNGTALFNVTILNTNGTVWLEINGTNTTATNLTANMYNVSYYLLNGTYDYRWYAYGNGSSTLLNNSGVRNYIVNGSEIDPCVYTTGNWVTPCSCTINSPVNLLGNSWIINGTGTFIVNTSIYNYSSLRIFGVDNNNKCLLLVKGSIY